MAHIPLYVSPSGPNQTVLKKLYDLGKLDRYTRINLSPSDSARIEHIQTREDTAVFIGGGGSRHHESFYFTRWSIAPVKINLDYHHDTYGLSNTEIHCANHMTHTHNSGKKVVIPWGDGTDNVFVSEYSKSIYLSRDNPFQCTLKEHVARVQAVAMELAMKTDIRVDMTIDCDMFYGFPSEHQWVFERGEKDPRKTAELIRAFGKRIGKVDIFGLWEVLCGFDIDRISSVPFEKNPDVAIVSCEEIREFYKTQFKSRFGFIEPCDEKGKDCINRLMSYAVYIYGLILDAYADAKGF